MNKQDTISSQIDDELFNQGDIDFIDEKIELNLPKLLGCAKYIEIDRKMSKINLELISTLDDNQRKLFNDYQMLALDATSYQNCLAYYIGHKSKIEEDKLK
jgi:hypothetical protein